MQNFLFWSRHSDGRRWRGRSSLIKQWCELCGMLEGANIAWKDSPYLEEEILRQINGTAEVVCYEL